MNSFPVLIFVAFAANRLLISEARICCPRNQEYVQDTKDCPPTCEFRHPPCYNNGTRTTPGCQCKNDFLYLNSITKRCVSVGSCPHTCSQPHFKYNECGSRCPITCQNRKPGACILVCEPGCFCEQPFILNEITMQCVLEDDCPCPDVDE